MTLFIGDVHGHFARYKTIIKNHADTIQVGDMGVGFIHPNAQYSTFDSDSKIEYMANPPHKVMLEGNHRFIRGNHDNPSVCKKHSQWIKDGTIEGEVMFIGGATSIDKAYRVKDYTWWEDEEVSVPDLSLMVDIYRNQRPRVMVTHECPQSIADEILQAYNKVKYHDPSATRTAFQVMLESHQPDIWIFGHWHHSFDKLMNGTRFVCLAELEAKEIEVGL